MVGVLPCDQSAAFYLCDHGILIEKLKLLGLEEQATTWVKSYLSGRKQSCFIDGELSTPLNLLVCGVPQGSIGGPLLWLCFTCDQPDVIHNHEVDGEELQRGCGIHQLRGSQGGVEQVDEEVLGNQVAEQAQEGCGELVGYVDDGAYSYANRDPVVLSEVLNEKYKLLERWMNNNKLVINPDKTHLMVMAGRGLALQRERVSMMAGVYNIKPTETETLLGGHIHQSLHWNQHIRDHEGSLIRQLTYRINGLKRIARNSTFQTKLMIANGAVMSKLVYLITV